MDRETAEPSVDTIPGPTAREWVDHHRRTAATSTYVYDFVWDITADAIGPFCTDVDGNVLLDFTSHVGAAPLGYNHPGMIERLASFGPIDPLKIAGQDFYVGGGGTPDEPTIPGPMHLMDRLRELTDSFGMDRVFLSNSGAEAVENALKICYAATGGTRGITFEGAFHGRTLGALSCNRSKAVHRRRYPELAGIAAVPFCRDRSCDADRCSCGFFRSSGSVLRERLDPSSGDIPPEDVAFLIIEPIQGEGGYRIPSPPFMDEVADICSTHDIPLIADEIQAGLGRTGTMWASEQFGVTPDVITAGKGLRVGATVSRSELFPDEPGRISSTWGGGDLVASLQGVVTIDTILNEGLMDNAIERGEELVELLRDADLDAVLDVRGRGLFVGIDFPTRRRRNTVIDGAFERGLLTLGCGHRTIRLLPPLDVTEREIRLGVDILVDAIEDTD